jgi:hypothetical protein
MANINDYLLWRGDLPIDSKYKFNEIDSMILARFSYLRFDKIEMETTETIKSISEKMSVLKESDFRYNGDKELITYLGNSKRFQNMIVTNYEQHDNAEFVKQFAAITIHISNKELYISYLGTDSTILGWQEDFNMTFLSNVPCQVEGLEYLKRIAEKYPSKKIRMGGHSKGGNVAIYSALRTSKEIQDRLIKVYNYDGPGLKTDILTKYAKKEILKKMQTYIPQESVIGRLLIHKEKCTVVYSTENGIYQHDIFSWQVMKDDIVKTKQNTLKSEEIHKAVVEWLENTTVEQRKIFFCTIFELFYSTEAKSFGEISKSLTTSLPRILKKYGELEKEDKDVLIKMIKLFAKSYWSVFKERESLKIGNNKQEAKEKIRKRAERFLAK